MIFAELGCFIAPSACSRAIHGGLAGVMLAVESFLTGSALLV